MTSQIQIGKDSQFIVLNIELMDLKQKQQKIRPATYFLLAIILFIVSLAIIGVISGVGYLLALASLLALLAGITVLVNKNKLAGQIKKLEADIERLKTSEVGPQKIEDTPAVETSPSNKLAELRKMLESNLISQEESETKKAEILKRL